MALLRIIHFSLLPALNARNNTSPRTKYSVTCASFLIAAWISYNSPSGTEGLKNSMMGPITASVRADENVSVDIQNMNPITAMAGTQYLRNVFPPGRIARLYHRKSNLPLRARPP